MPDRLPLDPPNRKTPPGRLYVFLVTALTCYLLGIMLWQTPIRGYVALTTVGVEGAEEPQLRWFRRQLKDDEFIRSALKKANHNRGEAAPITSVQVRRAKDAVGMLEDKRPGSISLTYFDADRAQALLVADALTTELIERNRNAALRTAVQAENQQLSAEFQTAEKRVEDSKRSLNEFLVSFFSRISSGEQTDSDSASNPWPAIFRLVAWSEEEGLGLADSPLLSGGEQVNPHWMSLQKQLNRLYDLRQTRQQAVGVDHPSLREIDQKINDITRELDQTPRQLEIENPHFRPLRRMPPVEQEEIAPPESVAVAPPAAQPAAAPELPSVPAQAPPVAPPRAQAVMIPADSATPVVEPAKEDSRPPSARRLFDQFVTESRKYFLLKQAVDLAERDLAKQKQRLREPLEEDRLLQGSPALVLQSSQISKELGGPPSRTRVGMLGCFALLVGLAFSRVTRSKASYERLQNVVDVEATLPVPVVAALTGTETESASAGSARFARIIRAVVLTCEVTLMILVLAMFYLALQDSELTAHFARDPFSAMTEVYRRFTGQ